MNEMTLEQGLAELEKITEKLEAGNIALEEMFGLYKEGVELVRQCHSKIDTVEKNMLLLDKDGEYKEFQ